LGGSLTPSQRSQAKQEKNTGETYAGAHKNATNRLASAAPAKTRLKAAVDWLYRQNV
jgi:hypothetical protein